MMYLLRCLFFIRAHFQIWLWAVHIPGIGYTVVDAISHNNLCLLFRSRNPSDGSHQSCTSYYHCCWISTWTGPQSTGLNSAATIFSRLINSYYHEQLLVRGKVIPYILSVFWSVISLSGVGSDSLMHRGFPVPGKALRSDGEELPSGNMLHPDITGIRRSRNEQNAPT